MEKIHIDELTEKALGWFYTLPRGDYETRIVKMYMEEFNIKEEKVNW
jgi:hypothetical protein